MTHPDLAPTSSPQASAPIVRRLGTADYEEVWRAMRDFVAGRGPHTPDELWLLQHPPVYTCGLNCSLAPARWSGIPVVHADRGGQITYHGPGQLVLYALLDLRRRHAGVKGLVSLLEQSVIDLLAHYGIAGERRDRAPGVYVAGRKIAALGVRIRRGCSYHGLSLNVDMDLGPFEDIDPCGFAGLEVTQLRDLGIRENINTVADRLTAGLLKGLAQSPATASSAPIHTGTAPGRSP